MLYNLTWPRKKGPLNHIKRQIHIVAFLAIHDLTSVYNIHQLKKTDKVLFSRCKCHRRKMLFYPIGIYRMPFMKSF